MTPLRVYLGYDPREHAAYQVAKYSLLKHASGPVIVTPVRLDRNEAWGTVTRPWIMKDEQMYDIISRAPQSTEFAITRFLVPILAQEGIALFADSDVVFMDDVFKLVGYAEDMVGAVFVCKHSHTPREKVKMDNRIQSQYARKNWSSVVLWNVDHPSNRKLTLEMINNVPGRDLHGFCWLDDIEIVALPLECNWLVGVEPKPSNPIIAHFTLGGPWLQNWRPHEHDEIWMAAFEESRVRSLRSGEKSIADEDG